MPGGQEILADSAQHSGNCYTYAMDIRWDADRKEYVIEAPGVAATQVRTKLQFETKLIEGEWWSIQLTTKSTTGYIRCECWGDDEAGAQKQVNEMNVATWPYDFTQDSEELDDPWADEEEEG